MLLRDSNERKGVSEFTEKMDFGETRVYSLNPSR